MINIYEYLLSKQNKKVKDVPIKGEIAYDWEDCEWEILDFCKFGEKDKVEALCRKYDQYGQFWYDEYDDDPDTYIVAAQEYPVGDTTTIFLWSEDGLHFK